jgi:hypothetical protein
MIKMSAVSRRKNIIFLIYYSIVIILIAFPGPFDWANRIEPWIIGLPFSMFYLIFMVALLAIGVIAQYLVEGRLGELDIEVTPISDNGGDQ